MYTAIGPTGNLNIEGSSGLLDSTSTEKRSYQYNRFFYLIVTNTLMIYTEVPDYV